MTKAVARGAAHLGYGDFLLLYPDGKVFLDSLSARVVVELCDFRVRVELREEMLGVLAIRAIRLAEERYLVVGDEVLGNEGSG